MLHKEDMSSIEVVGPEKTFGTWPKVVGVDAIIASSDTERQVTMTAILSLQLKSLCSAYLFIPH